MSWGLSIETRQCRISHTSMSPSRSSHRLSGYTLVNSEQDQSRQYPSSNLSQRFFKRKCLVNLYCIVHRRCRQPTGACLAKHQIARIPRRKTKSTYRKTGMQRRARFVVAGAHSRGKDSFGSQGLVRKLLRPRYLSNLLRAGISVGVSICAAPPHAHTHPLTYICSLGHA